MSNFSKAVVLQPGDLSLVSREKLTNQKHSKAQLSWTCFTMILDSKFVIDSFSKQNLTFGNVIEQAIPFTYQHIHES